LDGRWCLADFGISRYAEATTAPDTRKLAWTPAYAAPEQWRAEPASAATDVYALGVIAYELLAGIRPFRGTARTTCETSICTRRRRNSPMSRRRWQPSSTSA
jgi:serine/threonine protein kinase